MKITKPSLLKMTKKDINALLAARGSGLLGQFTQDNYVYLVTGDGTDEAFKGFDNDINAGVNAPYKVCAVHTQQSWEASQSSQNTEETTPTTPTTPTE